MAAIIKASSDQLGFGHPKGPAADDEIPTDGTGRSALNM